MSDVDAFTSYFAKLAKEHLAKLIFYVIAAIMSVMFIKWLILGGFSILFSGFFSLIGLGGHDDKDTIRDQGVAIEQLAQTNEINTKTIEALVKANDSIGESLTSHYEQKQEKTKAFNDVINTGEKAFIEATNPRKVSKVGGSNNKTVKSPVGASAEKTATNEADPLDDPHSPTSLKLAQAQVTMVFDAYCLASGAVCQN